MIQKLKTIKGEKKLKKKKNHTEDSSFSGIVEAEYEDPSFFVAE